MLIILSQKVDTESLYSDELFNTYHYPARYKNQIHKGDVFIYYQGNRFNKEQRYYFGMLKISVKGSQDGSWGLTQGFKKDCDYHEAINRWLSAHGKKTILCLVQFKGVSENELPRMYLATPSEIAELMHSSRAGNGETILYEYHKWGSRSIADGAVDKIPEEWLFTEKRLNHLLEALA